MVATTSLNKAQEQQPSDNKGFFRTGREVYTQMLDMRLGAGLDGVKHAGVVRCLDLQTQAIVALSRPKYSRPGGPELVKSLMNVITACSVTFLGVR